MSSTHEQDVVVDVAKSRVSDFWKLEDYWAIWLGFALLFVAYVCFASSGPQEKAAKDLAPHLAVLKAEQDKPIKTIAWHNANDRKDGVQSRRNDAGRFIAKYLATPVGWSDNPIGAFYLSEEDAKARSAKAAEAHDKAKAATAASLEAAKSAEKEASDANFADAKLNQAAQSAIEKWRADVRRETRARDAAGVRGLNLFTTLPVLALFLGLLFAIGAQFMGWNVPRFFVGFLGVFFVAVLAMLLGNQAQMRLYGISAEAWAIVLGMLVANTVKTPAWLKPGLQVEYYIKTGLVLLGAEILLSKLIAIGTAGIFVAWVVTPTVLIATFIFGQKLLKIESAKLNIVISADMSVCGTSAAIATAAACKAKKEELTVAIGISLAFTAVMMILMPMGIKALGFNQV
ncbi:MAG: YeiH family protein, partial [Deltaproteobacteria bacterium]|nr:YeiH family protein [Deltaproteobacteria bacterium]